MANNGIKQIIFLIFIITYGYWESKVKVVDFIDNSVDSRTLVKDVFILAGQSNMAGRGGVINRNWDGIIPPEIQPNPGKILRLGGDLNWEDAEEPLHADIDTNKTCGVGPGMAFANSLLRRDPGRLMVGLVPCAIGGSGIDEWSRGGRLYDRLVRRAAVAVEGGGEIKAVLWFQGERDTVNISDAESYREKLERLYIDLRTDLKSPLLTIIQVALASGEGAYVEKVREAQHGIQLPNVITVDAKGLELQPDGLHLSTYAQVQVGEMLAHAYSTIRLLSLATGN